MDALGTAAGDLTAATLGLGYLGSTVLFLVVFAIPGLVFVVTRRAAVTTFWAAYVMTRPSGAPFADWFAVPQARGGDLPICNLGYTKEDLVQGVGFWYYIFGEGAAERWVRTLPITSRSSHGRTTRGSGLTVEVFWAHEATDDTSALRDFAEALLIGLEPIMPEDRAEYFVP